MATNRYLIRPDEGEWILEHNGKAVNRYGTHALALEEARARAVRESGEVVTVDEAGFFDDHERYGSRGGGSPVG